MTSPDQLRANAEHLEEKVIRRRKALDWAARETEAARGTATSADGSVRVTVDQTGMLTELDIDPEALRQRKDTELARLIVDTTQQATADARNRVRDAYQGLVNEGTLRQLPPNLLPPPEVRPATPMRRTDRTEPDDDGEPHSWLNDLDWR